MASSHFNIPRIFLSISCLSKYINRDHEQEQEMVASNLTFFKINGLKFSDIWLEKVFIFSSTRAQFGTGENLALNVKFNCVTHN